MSSYQAFCESFSVPHHPCRWGTCSVFLATGWEVCLCIVSDPVKRWPTKMWSDYKQIRPIKIQIISENVTFVFWIFCLSGWNLMAQLKFISQQWECHVFLFYSKNLHMIKEFEELGPEKDTKYLKTYYKCFRPSIWNTFIKIKTLHRNMTTQ